MNALGRRGLLSLFGGVAVAAPRAANMAASVVSAGVSGAAIGITDGCDSSGYGIYTPSSNPVVWAAQKAFALADRREHRRRARRVGGLDPDLAMMGSTSLVWRMSRQEERDRVASRGLAKLRRAIGGDGDHMPSIYDWLDE